MHAEAYEWFNSELALLPPRQGVVDIGARNINGSLRSLFSPLPPYLGVDPIPGRGVDVVARGEDFAPPWTPDTVLCAEVLEHVPDDGARGICQNALAMLAPGGVFLASMAAAPRAPHSAVDGQALGPGEFYRNVTADDLRGWLEGFARVTWWQHEHGDLYVRAVKGDACR